MEENANEFVKYVFVEKFPQRARWKCITSEIKKKIYDRDFLKKKSIKTGSTHFFNAYKKARNQLIK
jgi:hypothetical protein